MSFVRKILIILTSNVFAGVVQEPSREVQAAAAATEAEGAGGGQPKERSRVGGGQREEGVGGSGQILRNPAEPESVFPKGKKPPKRPSRLDRPEKRLSSQAGSSKQPVGRSASPAGIYRQPGRVSPAAAQQQSSSGSRRKRKPGSPSSAGVEQRHQLDTEDGID